MSDKVLEAQAVLEADRQQRAEQAAAEYNQIVDDLQRRYNVMIVPVPQLLNDGRIGAIVQISGR